MSTISDKMFNDLGGNNLSSFNAPMWARRRTFTKNSVSFQTARWRTINFIYLRENDYLVLIGSENRTKILEVGLTKLCPEMAWWFAAVAEYI